MSKSPFSKTCQAQNKQKVLFFTSILYAVLYITSQEQKALLFKSHVIEKIMPRKSTLKLPPLDLGEESIGERIARLRKEQGYSQKALAEKMGIVRVLVSDYERNRIRPYPEMVARFALVFDITTDELIGLKVSKGDNKKPNLAIQKRMRRIKELPPAQQRVLMQTIDAFVKGVS